MRQGKHAWDWLGGIISAGSGHRSCLLTGSGGLEQEVSSPKCESPIKKVVGMWALDEVV